MILAGAAAAHAALIAAWAAVPARSPSPPPPSASPVAVAVTAPAPVVIATPPVVVPIEVPAPAPTDAFGDLGLCPDDVTRAPRGALVAPEEPVFAVAVSARDARRVVAWNDRHVFATESGGRTWRRVLDGPGAVLDAGFDCHGRLMVVRSGLRFGMRAGRDEAWTDLAGLADPGDAGPDDLRPPRVRVVAGGPHAAVLGLADDSDELRLAVRDDARDGWRYADLGWAEHDLAHATMASDGTITAALPWVDCRDEGIRVVTVRLRDGITSDLDLDAYVDTTTPILDGRVYLPAQLGADDDRVQVWHRGRWRPVTWDHPPAGDADDAPVLVPAGLIWHGSTLWRLDSARARRLRAAWPAPTLAPAAIDPAGRAWAATEHGELVRAP